MQKREYPQKRREVTTQIKKENYEGGQTLKEIAQKGLGVSMCGDTQN